MKTFGCNFGADVFARLFEQVIVPDVIKVDDGATRVVSFVKIFTARALYL
jgi:hypothetical protein